RPGRHPADPRAPARAGLSAGRRGRCTIARNVPFHPCRCASMHASLPAGARTPPPVLQDARRYSIDPVIFFGVGGGRWPVDGFTIPATVLEATRRRSCVG